MCIICATLAYTYSHYHLFIYIFYTCIYKLYFILSTKIMSANVTSANIFMCLFVHASARKFRPIQIYILSCARIHNAYTHPHIRTHTSAQKLHTYTNTHTRTHNTQHAHICTHTLTYTQILQTAYNYVRQIHGIVISTVINCYCMVF